jgi:type II pantothenate kinase
MGKVFRKNLISNKSTQTHQQSNSEQMLTPEMEEDPNFKPQDICASLLYMVSNNIGQIAYLNAKAHNIQYIYFGGFFIRGKFKLTLYYNYINLQ